MSGFTFAASFGLIKISEVRGPSSVQNGSTSRLILDCVFSADEEDRESLVVKWYFNKGPVAVYQWIPGNKPQVSFSTVNCLNLFRQKNRRKDKQINRFKIFYLIQNRSSISILKQMLKLNFIVLNSNYYTFIYRLNWLIRVICE